MHIGLIGGIGPAATIAYYQRLVSSFAKAAVPLKLTITHADISVLTANASQDLRIQQAAVFSDHLSQLQAGGCDIALITALTGHFCFAETAVDSAVPLLNGIDVIDKHCRKQGIKRLGLLGSPPVLKTALFGMLTSPEAVRPTDPVNLGEAYMDVAMSGVCSDAQRALFFEAGAEMILQQGATAVLLAGTDLGLVFGGHDPGYVVVDALELHVQALLALAKS